MSSSIYLEKKRLRLRYAKLGDLETLFCWANEQTAKWSSFDRKNISFQEHSKWFKSVLSDKKVIVWIFGQIDIDVGVVRYNRTNGNFRISFYIDKPYRRLGLATLMLNKSLDKITKKFPGIPITAEVREGNAASVQALLKVGFEVSMKNSKTIYLIRDIH